MTLEQFLGGAAILILHSFRRCATLNTNWANRFMQVTHFDCLEDLLHSTHAIFQSGLMCESVVAVLFLLRVEALAAVLCDVTVDGVLISSGLVVILRVDPA